MKNRTQKDIQLAQRAMRCWQALEKFRYERERCKNFTYGNQWGDTVVERGIRLTEEELIRNQGNVPLKNNLIRRLVRNVLGVFRNRYSLPDLGNERLNDRLRRNAVINRIDELYCRSLEEFLISGLAVHKKWFGCRNGITACWTDNVSPVRFFFDRSSRDPRGFDVEIIGEIHEMSVNEYNVLWGWKIPLDSELESNSDRMIRIIEVWERHREPVFKCHNRSKGRMFSVNSDMLSELKMTGNENLKVYPQTREWWQYTFLTSDGSVLETGESPYPHAVHPYVFKIYPFIDGEIHSFVADIIDQQKLTNRLISMYDWILRASAKGVLLFPEGALPDGVDINDIADEWSRFNGLIIYKPRAGVPLPQQISSKSADIGITQLLEIQMKMMEDISGVNGALQGRLDSGSVSGTLYSQQTQNSMIALADLLGSYQDFMFEAARKELAFDCN